MSRASVQCVGSTPFVSMSRYRFHSIDWSTVKKSFDVIYQLVGQALHGFVARACYARRQNKIWTIK